MLHKAQHSPYGMKMLSLSQFILVHTRKNITGSYQFIHFWFVPEKTVQGNILLSLWPFQRRKTMKDTSNHDKFGRPRAEGNKGYSSMNLCATTILKAIYNSNTSFHILGRSWKWGSRMTNSCSKWNIFLSCFIETRVLEWGGAKLCIQRLENHAAFSYRKLITWL